MLRAEQNWSQAALARRLGLSRQTGQNDYGYRYGNIKLVNLGYENKLGSRFDAMIQANHENSGRDRVDATGMTDPDTGGCRRPSMHK